MSTGAIIAIIVAAVIIIGIFAFLMPRMRARQEERRIQARRREVAGAHREHAEERMAEADRAEVEARRRRAEAELHQERAELHEQGMADEELETEHERFVRTDDGSVADDRTTTVRRDDA